MPLLVTSLVAAIFALMMVPLSLQISMRRMQVRTTATDTQDDILRHRIRAHGNFTEYAPSALILLALVEVGGAPAALVWSLGAAFVATRIMHAAGMLYLRRTTVRGMAIMVQHAAFIVAGGWLLLHVIG